MAADSLAIRAAMCHLHEEASCTQFAPRRLRGRSKKYKTVNTCQDTS